MNPIDIDRRIARLEKRNRQLVFIVLGLFAFVSALAVAGQSPNVAAAPALPRIVTASAFRVVDDKDKVRAELGMGDGGSQLILFDGNGKARVKILSDLKGSGPAFSILGDDGITWVAFGGGVYDNDDKFIKIEPFFVLQNRNGTRYHGIGSNVRSIDVDGKVRGADGPPKKPE